MDDLHGKIALVTGASRGIGRATALALARYGADLVLNYVSQSDAADSVASDIRSLGRRCLTVQADVSRPSEVRSLIDQTTQNFGTIHILVNNAGIARVQRPEEIAEADWDEIIDVNLKSCFLVSQAVLPYMRAQKWGRIINLSSAAAHVGGVVGPHYAASKAGMLGLMHYFASNYVKEGITANAISPALIETDMVTQNINATPDKIPVGRFGHVDETAEVAVMLARNGYITGQTIHVNGGWIHS